MLSHKFGNYIFCRTSNISVNIIIMQCQAFQSFLLHDDSEVCFQEMQSADRMFTTCNGECAHNYQELVNIRKEVTINHSKDLGGCVLRCSFFLFSLAIVKVCIQNTTVQPKGHWGLRCRGGACAPSAPSLYLLLETLSIRVWDMGGFPQLFPLGANLKRVALSLCFVYKMPISRLSNS